MRVGYQGQSGAYSSIVIDQLFGHVAKEGQRTLSDLFLALQSEKVDIAVIPIENTTVGTITQSYDLLDEYAFTIVGEYYLDIEHALIAISGGERRGYSLRLLPSRCAWPMSTLFITIPGLGACPCSRYGRSSGHAAKGKAH
jgi:hypothetical protein